MIKLVRRHDWDIRFTEFIIDSMHENVCLDWENFTCASWIADGIREMVEGEVDLYADFREVEITSPESAYKAIKYRGFESFDAIIAARLPEKGVVFAQRGDVCLIPADLAEVGYSELGMPNALCFADPPYAWNITPKGVGRTLLMDAVKVFAVGLGESM